MMNATELAMPAQRRSDVIHFQAICFSHPAIVRMRAARRFVSAAFATIPVASLRVAPSDAPPVIRPECIGTAVAAPSAAPLGKLAPTPRTERCDHAMRERAIFKKRMTFVHLSVLARGRLVRPARACCLPVQARFRDHPGMGLRRPECATVHL
jgi:hypothetical protein